MALTAAQLAERLQFDLKGDGEVALVGVNDLRKASTGELSFLASARYLPFLHDTTASAVIMKAADLPHCPPAVVALITSDPYLGYARAAQLLHPPRQYPPGVHPSATVDTAADIDPSAHVAANCFVGAGARLAAGVVLRSGCVIEDDVTVGANTVLEPNVTLMSGVTIGARCLLHSGAVIGCDGFGFANDQGKWVKIPQVGSVVIGDDVEVGANTTIDRGAVEDTVISDGVKLDNLIQIAHNVRIGRDTAIAGCTGIAGSAVIGERCAIGGGVGITGHIEIADEVMVTGRSFVAQDISEAGSYSSETPLQPTRAWRRNYLRFRDLDEIARRLKKLERKLLEADDNTC